MEIIQQLINSNKYKLKCPYELKPRFITIHNTGNDASAQNEINYMQRNSDATGFHIAVDDKVAILGIPLNRNAWHAGDGLNGIGNRQSIGIEICYSTDYISDKHEKAFMNAVEVTKQLMQQFNIPIENVRQHYDWTKKNCPHRIRQEGTWKKFLSLCSEKKEESEVSSMGFVKGYQVLKWIGQTVHCYMQKSDQELGMISAFGTPAYKALQTIDKIEDECSNLCKVNANYFQMGGAENGQHYGVEITPQNEFAPKQADWLALWVDKFNKVHHALAKDFWLGKNDVKFACSPAAIMLHNGVDVEHYSSACGKGKITTANTQTLLLQLKTGEFVLAVVSGKLNGYQCRDFAKAYGAIHMSMYDSGGSSQMIVDGDKKVYTGRAIPNVFTFFKNETVVPTPDPQPEVEHDYMTINVDSLGLRVRKELKFSNGKPVGEIIGFIPVGNKAKVIDMVDGIQKDGYQWAKVEFNGIVGYSQYDSACYWIDDGGKE